MKDVIPVGYMVGVGISPYRKNVPLELTAGSQWYVGDHQPLIKSGYWLMCEGQEVSAKKYPQLAEVMGDAYGVGREGYFMMPDTRKAQPPFQAMIKAKTNVNL